MNVVHNMIMELDEDEIFVFGSNTAGIHGAGAALQARKMFGAQTGTGEGLTGRCYAFPTLDEKLRKRNVMQLLRSRDRLFATCRQLHKMRFLLTKVGCGLAGYDEEYMKDLFDNPPRNLILPEDWR